MRILLVSGSQRPASLNTRLLRELAAHVPPDWLQDPLRPGEMALPLFDQDREGDPAILAALRVMHARFAMADAFLVASPEFNGMMTPWLKNLVDWVSRLPRIDPTAANAFLDKPVLLASATPGPGGGALGLMAMRMLLGHVGAIAFGETVNLPFATQAWDGAGMLVPALREAGWRECVRRFCAFAATRSLEKAA